MSSNRWKSRIVCESTQPTLNHARDELVRFLSPYIEHGTPSEWRFLLEIDPACPAYSFGIDTQHSEDQTVVRLYGSDAAGVLHAAYTLLEHLGYQFEITGTIAPERIKLDSLQGWAEHVEPLVKSRGIRQHINFPMDISSYSQNEARQYLLNLARMRFNTITFHSYPNQWIEGPQASESELAGGFFYGQRHDIPDMPLLQRSIRNERTFCIPEIEPVFDESQERSRQAVAWLHDLIDEAKRLGFTVQFSFEPRAAGTDLITTLKTCATILNSYPQIDRLELITQETGDGAGQPEDGIDVRETLEQYLSWKDLPPEIRDGILSHQHNAGLNLLVGELGHSARIIGELFRTDHGQVELCLGIYCVAPALLGICASLMRQLVPQNVALSFLPGHGSQRVARHLRQVDMPPEDWSRSMIYSWIEFDGLMYLQQNGVSGVRELLERLPVGCEGSMPGICFNHWRTAENRTLARYAALATIYGPQSEEAFYRAYAARLGIGSVDNFCKAMTTLNETERRATEDVPNAGFCYVGCWGREGLGYFGQWETAKITAVGKQFAQVHDLLGVCAGETHLEAGRDYLSFLDNRVRCSMLYMKAIGVGTELQNICCDKQANELSLSERAQVVSICNRALGIMDQYMALHAEQLVDRGCEGTLISVYYTPPAVLKRIRAEYGGIEFDDRVALDQGLDAPPSPIQF